MADRKQSPEEELAALAGEDSEADSLVDSASDDEDLLQPERRRCSHRDDSSSESDGEYEPQPSSSSAGSSSPKDTQSKGEASSNPMTRVRRSPRGGSPALRWRSREEKDRGPAPRGFMPARVPGPALDPLTAWSPLALFRLFFSPSVVQRLVDNTNANALKRSQAGKEYVWKELTVSDFYVFLAITILSALVHVAHRSDYWLEKGLYDFPFAAENMSQERFENILWSLHMSDPEEDEENERKSNTAEYDRLFKIKPLYTDIVAACKAHFQPHRNISIDERMVASKAVEPHMRGQSVKWGYKLLVLVDSSTAYTWNFSVCTAESTAGRGPRSSSVTDLLPLPLLGQGYTLFVDSLHTSPALFEHLATKNIGCCGIIRRNGIGFPQTELNDLPKKAERGDLRWIRRGELLFVKWMDSWEVCMCSTVHEAFSGRTLRRKVKRAGEWQIKMVPVPDAVVDYRRSMRGEDVSDVNYSARRKTKKWYKTFFYHFLEISVVNSFLLHEELLRLSGDRGNTTPHTQKAFKERLAADMLQFAEGCAAPPPPPLTCMPTFYGEDGTQSRGYCRRCHDAGCERVKTPVYCSKCLVPLCLTAEKNCFVEWHLDTRIQDA